MTLTWVDGYPAAGVPVHDRGVADGDGLFETIRVVDQRPLLLSRRLQRLEAGCQRLNIPCQPEQLRAQILEFSAALGDGVAKLILTRGDGQRGYAPPRPSLPRTLLLGSPAPAYPREHAERGVQLYPCATRLAEQPALAGMKHLNRLEQVLARSEWQDPAFAEGLMRDMSGRVIEGVYSNIFLISKGVLQTPSLERCGIAGVMRAEILERAQRAGIAVEVCDVSFEALLAADEVFVCNSLYGIWPVRQLKSHVWPLGPLTRKLQNLIADLSSGT